VVAGDPVEVQLRVKSELVGRISRDAMDTAAVDK